MGHSLGLPYHFWKIGQNASIACSIAYQLHINDTAIDRLTQIACSVLLIAFPTITETMKAIQYLSYGKVRENDRVVSWLLDERGYPTRIQGCTLLKVCYNHSDVSYSLSYQLLEMVYLQNPIESPECAIPYSGKTEER